MSETSNPEAGSRRAPLALFLVVSVMCSFVFPMMRFPSPGGMLATMLLLGMVAGQYGLLAIWAAVGAERWVVRLPMVLSIAAGLYGVSLFGFLLAGLPPDILRQFGSAILMMPLVFAAVQLPLWIARLTAGFRLVFGPDAEKPQPWRAGQFGVQHLLGAATVLAVVLGLATVGVSRFAPLDSAQPQVWTSLMIVCLGAAGAGTLIALPCVWAMFVAQRRDVAVMGVLLYTLIGAIAAPTITLLFLSLGVGSGAVASLFAVSFGLLAGCMGMILIGLQMVRVCGYTVVRHRRGATEDETSDDAPLENGEKS